VSDKGEQGEKKANYYRLKIHALSKANPVYYRYADNCGFLTEQGMSPQQQHFITHHIAARLWVLWFAFLLALLPVSSYSNSADSHSDTGLVSHLDAQTVWHDTGLRLGLKTEQSGQTAPDSDPPDWQALLADGLFTGHAGSLVSKPTGIFSVTASDNRFLRPYLRAPPLS